MYKTMLSHGAGQWLQAYMINSGKNWCTTVLLSSSAYEVNGSFNLMTLLEHDSIISWLC